MERDNRDDSGPGATPGVLEALLLALSTTGICYGCYFLLAPWIWSQNIPFHPEDLTPWILDCTKEHDGVEIYALYLLSLVNLAGAAAVSGLLSRLKGAVGRRSLLITCLALSALLCAAVGFTPPMNSFLATPRPLVIRQSLELVLAAFPLLALLLYLQRRKEPWGVALAALLLAPACFLASSPVSWTDYAYIFAPALRLVNGAALCDIYFQYDFYLSALAAGWMKLGWPLSRFQILGQASYYLAILGVFVFASRIFRKKGLAVFLLAALVLGRLYASPWDVTSCFQVTPLRLDLWLPLLVLVYCLGPFHRGAPLLCGVLLLAHRTFGIIYSAAYLQLLLTLCALEYFDDPEKGPWWPSLVKYGRRFLAPGAIMAACWASGYLLFRNGAFPDYSGYYQKIGIGFIRIAPDSFYWYVPAIMGATVILLFRLRHTVPPAYLATGYLLTFCAIGNSIYFFGRSHEHNILNIAIVLLFLCFFLLDLIDRALQVGAGGRSTPSFAQRDGALCAAGALVVVIIVSYSGNIAGKLQAQYHGRSTDVVAGQVDPSALPGFYDYLAQVREATGNSAKVYFVGGDDFALYYYGGYQPTGYCNPFQTWIFTGEMNRFLQGLLDRGYFLVCHPSMKQLADRLSYSRVSSVGDSAVLSRSPLQVAAP